MATDIKISQMPSATSLAGTELIPIVQNGANKTTTPAKIKEGLATVAQLGNKVDKDGNKVLSEQDFTTKLKSKLDGIEAEANKYEHPANHPASIITQDATHRFVTDAEKATWNGKANTEDIPDVSGFATTAQLNTKVDKDGSKVLSEQNFTTVLKTKLDGIAVNANNYVHPTTHPASIIVQDASHKFVSDVEKNTWNNKSDNIVVELVSTSTQELQPNKYYVFGEVETLTLTLASGSDTILNEYMFEFTSGATPTVLTEITGVEWKGDTIEANKLYQASISRGIGILIGRAKV